MEEESESITELKSRSGIASRNNVLEAMAKFNMQKQQLEKEKMMQSTKKDVKPKLKEEDQFITPKESNLGITEYVNQKEGFSAIVKQRYSDFQVHEVDMLGNIAHLTDQTLPEKVEEAEELTEEQINSLSSKEWASIESLLDSTTVDGETPSVQIDVTSKSKEDRLLMHKAIRKKFKNIISDSKPGSDGKTIMNIRKVSFGCFFYNSF